MVGFKTFEVCQQLQYLDTIDLKVIEDRVRSLTQFKDFAMIIHDKDINHETNNIKAKHIHIVVQLKNTMTIETISDVLKIEKQYINKIKKSTKAAYLYLIHRNNPEKYQYNVSDVIASFDYSELVDDSKPLVNREDIALSISNGYIKRYNLSEFIDVREYAKNKDYYEKCFQYRLEKINSLDRDLNCIYLYGNSSTGKTSFAKDIAKKLGYHTYIASAGKNPFDSYKGEECIILDDLRGYNWEFSDFLKLTDNNTDSMIACRYYNKSINECRLIICTNVNDLKYLSKQFNNALNEEIKQLQRRFARVYHLDDKYIYQYLYNIDTDSYNFCGSILNTFSSAYILKNDTLNNSFDVFTLYDNVNDVVVDNNVEDLPF